MVKYTGRPGTSVEASADEKVVEYVSALYSIGEELGMESEFTEVETGDSDHVMEYFETTSLEYDVLDQPQIQDVEMELELEEGEITAEYTEESQVFKVNLPVEYRNVFEDELGEEFRMGVGDRLRNTASAGFEALRNRKNQVLP